MLGQGAQSGFAVNEVCVRVRLEAQADVALVRVEFPEEGAVHLRVHGTYTIRPSA